MNPAVAPPRAPPPPLPRSMPITLLVVKYNPYPIWNPFARKPLANPPRNISLSAINWASDQWPRGLARINSSYPKGMEKRHEPSTFPRVRVSGKRYVPIGSRIGELLACFLEGRFIYSRATEFGEFRIVRFSSSAS